MAAIRDRDETRARDGALVNLAAVEGRDRVVATPDEQCRRAHALQEVAQSEAVHIGLPRNPAGHLAVLFDEVGLFRRPFLAPVAHELGRLIRPIEGAPQPRHAGVEEIVEDLALFGLDAHRAHPHLADGTAVAPEQLREVFTAIPGVGFPAHPPQVVRLDFGAAAGSGIATTLPPAEGKPYLHFVAAVDRDGNEVTGIRLPDLSVPLATYTGWNLRHPQMGAPDRLMSLMGSTIPFPVTPEERARRSDPRRSIAERYPSRARYLGQVRQEAQRLIDEGYLLAEDLELVVGQASRRYELLATAREPVAVGE
jgi:hypothetical protein